MKTSWKDSLAQLSVAEQWRVLEAARELEWRRCRQDPKRFLFTHVRTQDEHDLLNPYKQIPTHLYLLSFVDYLVSSHILICVKSRQMMISWIVAAFILWDTMFNQGRRNFIQSETQEKANALLARIRFIYESLPIWMRERCPIRFTEDEARCPTTRSEIRAIPQGPNQLRMFTASRVWSDETASQKYCAESYKAMKPTVVGKGDQRGQVVFTSTPAQAWFELLADDKLEVENPPPPLNYHEVCHGMHVRTLAKSRHVRVDIHYTADPEKRSPEWKALAKEGVSDEDWEQEYELNFKVRAGSPALTSFRKFYRQIVIPPFEIPPHWPRWGSADYGYRNPYSYHSYTADQDGNIYVYWEHYAPGLLKDHCDAISGHPDFPLLSCIILDKSCWAENQQASMSVGGQTVHMARSLAELHNDHGVYPIPAAILQDRMKVQLLENLWRPCEAGLKPRLYIFNTCANLIRELPNIRWKPLSYAQKLGSNESEKLVDQDNHAFDELTYFVAHRNEVAAGRVDDVPPAQLAQEAARKLRNDDMERCRERQEEQERGDGLDWD